MSAPFDPLSVAVRIADRLCEEALRHAGRATWLGDEKANVGGRWEVVHRSVDGDLYGGTGGIGLFLARLFAVTGDGRFRTTALEAFAHAVEWQRRGRASGSLYAGSAGIAAALAEAGRRLGVDALLEDAKRLADDAIDHPPAECDLIGGRAGTIVALLYVARTLELERARDAARGLGLDLVDEALGEPYPGASWRSDIGADESPLCGLGHGASGVGFALGELALAVDEPRLASCAAAAARYERAWFHREQGNWPDLRELTRSKLARGEGPAFPMFWCHGGVGIGLARLRQYELTRETVYAVEAETALLAGEKQFAQLTEEDLPVDLCVCHGLAGFVELLLEGARVLDQPRLRDKALAFGRLALEQGRGGEGPWPCGVPDGGESPSLMLGLAGIGMMFLRLADPGVAATGLLYHAPTVSQRVIVQLADSDSPVDAREHAEALAGLVPGSRVERISRRGRVLLRLPAGASVDGALATLGASSGVRYAEADVTDHTAPSDSSGGG